MHQYSQGYGELQLSGWGGFPSLLDSGRSTPDPRKRASHTGSKTSPASSIARPIGPRTATPWKAHWNSNPDLLFRRDPAACLREVPGPDRESLVSESSGKALANIIGCGHSAIVARERCN